MDVERLCGRAAQDGSVAQNRGQHVIDIVGRADIACSCRERSHPHVFIRNAVRANDGYIRERLMQTREVAQRPMLQVKNNRVCMTAGDIIQQMFVRAGEVYREVRAKPASQRLRNRWIFLQNHNIQSHKSPEL